MTRSLAFLLVVSSSLVVGCGGGDSGGGPGGLGGSGGFGAGGSAGAAGAAGSGGSAGSSASGGSGGALGGSGGNGGNPQLELLDALGTSVWSALVMREGKQRAIELQFDASSLLWAEIRNPYGPARRRRLRIMQVDADGKTVNTTLNVPTSWPVEPENGKKEEYELVVQPGSPRTLLVTSGGVTETFTEGAWPAPETGLTAIVRVFANGGTMAGAFCDSNILSPPNRPVIWEFARGKSLELPLATEVVAGVPLDSWIDPTNLNQFAVTNVPGMNTLGGTLLSDQFNFIVTYLGRIAHGGGSLSLREQNDEVADAIWAFLGPNVGSSSTSNVFLEVHNHVPADLTPDEPSAVFAAGDVQAEFMVLRCDTPHEDIDIQINQGAGFVSMGQAATKPQIDSTLFPPAL